MKTNETYLSIIVILGSVLLVRWYSAGPPVFAQGPSDVAALSRSIEDLDSRIERQRQQLQTLQELSNKNSSALTQLGQDIANVHTEAFSQIDRVVPIGTILPYYGKPDAIPANWVLCMGQDSPGQPYPWTKIPDLRQRFLRGAQDRSVAETALGATGGVDYAPNHQHTASGSSNDVSFEINSINGASAGYPPVTAADGATFDNSLINLTVTVSGGNPSPGHGHSGGTARFTGRTSSDGGHDNRPAFTSVYFIIRIK